MPYSNFSEEKIKEEKQRLDDAVNKAKLKFQEEADLKYSLKFWFDKALKSAKPYITTHPAKFTNPQISNNVTNLFFYGTNTNQDYVKTGNINLAYKVDASGNAAVIAIIFEIYLLLETKITNNQKVIDLFKNDDQELINFIGSININYSTIKNKFIEVFYGKNSRHETHEMIKQIYFPILNEKSYHLLSVITPSMLMFEVKNRIDNLTPRSEIQKIRKLKKDNKFHSEGFEEIRNLTEIGFSHNEYTKMGNVSYLNVKNRGIAYLLPSFPPKFKEVKVKLPTQDFFKDILWIKAFKNEFVDLSKLIKNPRNNEPIRDFRERLVKSIIDKVLESVFKIRNFAEKGWSNAEKYKNLPLAQKIWLDDFYQEKRIEQDDWTYEISADFAWWIKKSYKNHETFGEAEVNYFDQKLQKVIHEESEAAILTTINF